jgi:hypothetical protein
MTRRESVQVDADAEPIPDLVASLKDGVTPVTQS